MLDWVVEAVAATGPSRTVVVVSPQTRRAIAESVPEGVEIAVQQEPRGTGDAVAAARDVLGDFEGDVLVVSGDAPLITADVLGELVAARTPQPRCRSSPCATSRTAGWSKTTRTISSRWSRRPTRPTSSSRSGS
jgi:bifunctional N-acetylglucosamine-1-phosphate-uridyltransferase/glucosamine-1-phosphate-acetyltransferase GlmU-like protein